MQDTKPVPRIGNIGLIDLIRRGEWAIFMKSLDYQLLKIEVGIHSLTQSDDMHSPPQNFIPASVLN